MKKKAGVLSVMALAVLSAAGCGDTPEPAVQEQVPSVPEEFACETDYRGLADFLAEYYRIPEEDRGATRYYYNYTDLNDDGTDEIFATVLGDYTAQDHGDPALLLLEDDSGGFEVLGAFDGIRTPVMVSSQTTNGWHDLIYQVYGPGADTGYLICRYDPQEGYRADGDELLDKMPPVSGTQILSNNLIDDMDRGRYLTLSPAEKEE